MATDFLGQNLNIGDDVIFLNYNGTSANLERGKITKVFSHTAEIGWKRRAEYKIVKILTNAPVVHGQWIDVQRLDYEESLKCSECGAMVRLDSFFDDIGNLNYCPNCGAKMDRGEDNETN